MRGSHRQGTGPLINKCLLPPANGLFSYTECVRGQEGDCGMFSNQDKGNMFR